MTSLANVNAQPKRILLIIRRLGMGGIERATITLANAMANAGHEVDLLVLKGTPELKPNPNVTVHYEDFERQARKTAKGLLFHILGRTVLKVLLPKSGFVWQGKMILPHFKRFLSSLEKEEGDFDLILIRGEGAYELLWNFQDQRCWLMIEAVVGRFKNRTVLPSWLLQKLYEGKNTVCVSHGIKQGYQDLLEEVKIHPANVKVIYNAVPLQDIRKHSQAPHTPHFDQPYLLHVARLVPEKGPTLLIEAYHRARKNGIKAPLVIIGDGSEKPKLKEMVKQLALSEHVHFIGMKSNPYPWMANASALIISSNFEGLGLVLIEANALGTQCIATDVPGGIREVLIEEQRELIAEHNAQSLAQKMQQALEHPISIKPEWADRFSEETIVPQFISLIESSDSVLH